MYRKIILFIISICLSSVNYIKAEIDHGTCGTNGERIDWVLDDDYTLTFSGSGEMRDYYYSLATNSYNRPWNVYSSQIVKVIIGEGISSIGNDAFAEFTNLASVSIPNSVRTIGDFSFSGCISLEQITIPDSVTSIGDRAFSRCEGLSSIVIPNSVKTIEYCAFQECTELVSVYMGNSISSMGQLVFYHCEKLQDVHIESLEAWLNIEFSSGSSPLVYAHNLFVKDELVTDLVIPNTVTRIGKYVFEGWDGLATVSFPESVTTIDDNAFYSCTGLSSIVIPNSVTSIGRNAFEDCESLTCVSIGNSVMSIGAYAFNKCPIQTLDVSMPVIKENMFSNFKRLKKLVIGNDVTSVENKAFANCSALTDVTIPNHKINIGSTVFSGCNNISEVHYQGNDNIDEYKFPAECSIVTGIDNLKDVLCNNATHNNIYAVDGSEVYVPIVIENYPYDCLINGVNDSIIVANINEKIITITGDPFCLFIDGEDYTTQIASGNCEYTVNLTTDWTANALIVTAISKESTKHVEIENNCSGELINSLDLSKVNDIEYLRVSGDLNGTDLLVIRRMENIRVLDLYNANIVNGGQSYYDQYTTSANIFGDYLLNAKSTLEVVKLPATVTAIGEYAFTGCTRLAGLVIPNMVATISGNCFDKCGKIKTVIIEDGTTDISIKLTDYMLQYCTLLNCKNLYLGRNAKMDFQNKISSSYYKSFFNPEYVTVGNNVTIIDDYEFYVCKNLHSIIIPSSVQSIGYNAFCCSLDELHINSLKAWCNIDFKQGSNPLSVAHKMYLDGKEITELVIPDGIEKVKDYAFAHWTNVTSVFIPNSVKSIGNYAFQGCKSVTSVDISNSVTSIGNRAFAFCTNLSAVTLPQSVTTIGDLAFCRCSEIRSVELPSSVKTIGSAAFTDCSNLSSITIPDSVTDIGNSTFFNCIKLATVNIPKSVTAIGYNVFYNCSSLSSITIPDAVTSIGTNAFYGCQNLATIKSLNPTPPEISSNTFMESHYQNAELFVAPGAKALYWIHPVWENFVHLGEIESMGVEATLSESSNFIITQSEGILKVSGLQDGEILTVYFTNGTKIATLKPTGGVATMNPFGLQGKVVVLSVRGKNAKVMLK